MCVTSQGTLSNWQNLSEVLKVCVPFDPVSHTKNLRQFEDIQEYSV